MNPEPSKNLKYQNNTIYFKKRRGFIVPALILYLVFLSVSAASAQEGPGAAGYKKEPAQRRFHFISSYQFRISENAGRDITIIRNIPRTSNHQKITGEKFSFPEPGELTTREIGMNLAMVYKLNKTDFIQYCGSHDKKSDDTLEIIYECDFLGSAGGELDGNFPFALYKMKKNEEDIITRKVMAILGVLELPDLSASTDAAAVYGVLEKIFHFIETSVSYTREKQKRRPLITLNLMRGNCISKTNLWRAMLSAVRIVSCDVSGIILKKKNHDVTHRFSVVRAAGRSVPFCPTNNRFAKLPPHYMILSYAKKDNRESGVSSHKIRFNITELKNPAASEPESPETEEHLGVSGDAPEPYEER